jgi:hypothetical protein
VRVQYILPVVFEIRNGSNGADTTAVLDTI